MPRTVAAQTHDVESQLYDVYVEHAERVEVGGVEFRGHKTGSTRFQKCNGEVIDIGAKIPKRSGPCPSPGKPRRVFVFEGEILGIDIAASIAQVRATDGKIYDIYFPEESKEIVTRSEGFGGGIATASNVMFGTGYSKKTTLRDFKVKDLKLRSKITIVSMLEGRADAVIR
jgi:hypothetical protein